jgi:putative nucleotidyltransferase with HDIG domain
MFVDNEPLDLRRLERLFGNTYHVLCAASGEEALRLLEQHDVALLITDQRLPGMTGTELLEQAASLRPHVVRIMLTAHADADVLVAAINHAQVYRYVTKPWDDEDFGRTVARALRHYEVTRSRHERAVRALTNGAGSQFDPEIVAAFRGLEALAQIRGHIARGDFGSRFLPFARPHALRVLPLEELVKVVEREPALAAAVLRAANAGLRAEEATMSLYAACSRLSADTLRNIISKGEAGTKPSYEAEVLRGHSRRCAAAAMLLAERTGTLDPDEAYTVGLLHDLGEALLRSLFPEEAESITRLGHPFAVEREVVVFGVDHARIGQWILDACNVPPSLSFAIQAHHDSDHVNDPSALLLQVADAIAGANDSSEMATLDALAPDRLALLRLTRADLARVHEMTTEMVGEGFDDVAA